MFELTKEALNLIAFSVETNAEAWLPVALRFHRGVGHGALCFNQIADDVAVISLVDEHNSLQI